MYIGSSRLVKYNAWNGAVQLNISTIPVTSGTYYNDPFVLSVQNLGAAAGQQIPLNQLDNSWNQHKLHYTES